MCRYALFPEASDMTLYQVLEFPLLAGHGCYAARVLGV